MESPQEVQMQEERKEYSQELFESYCKNSTFMFSTPEKSILAKGISEVIESTSISDLSQTLKTYQRKTRSQGGEVPIIIGTIPFDRDKPGRFIIPESVQWTGPQAANEKMKQEKVFTGDVEVRPVPDPFQYASGVEKALEHLKETELRKIVLSRSIEVKSSEPVNVQGLVRNLVHKNPTGYVFAVDLALDSSDTSKRALVGASPELLISKQGNIVVSNPLAGSIPRVQDPEEDRLRAENLLQSEKDLHEHSVVVDSVAEALRPFCSTLTVPETPSVISTETMWHLSTKIEGELIDPMTCSLELTAAVHPTPAVCGFPRDTARQLISEIEPFDRRYFTGAVGWCDLHGNGEWILSLRCAELDGETLNLFAGAGIVEGSSPLKETRETGAKFRTMLHALGIDTSKSQVELGGA